MSVESSQRSRTVEWEDPLAGAAKGRELAGLDYLTRISTGEIAQAPIARLLGMTLAHVEAGRAVFEIEPAEPHFYNPIGGVHGGVLATMLDSAISCAIHATLPPGTGYTTLELKTNFVRAATSDVPLLRCEGTIVHAGKRVATGEGRITDGDGTLYAHGTATCLILGGSR